MSEQIKEKWCIEVIKKASLITNKWSGGTTTQLMIYPKDGDFSRREFKWRVSSARVEIMESTFTCLPDITRIIMILDGILKLNHEGHHKTELNPYETDVFMGEWVTKSQGIVTDLNLMLVAGVKGEMKAYKILALQTNEILLDDYYLDFDYITHFFYCPQGNIRILINKEENRLESGDIMHITGKSIKTKLEIINDCDEDIMVVIGKILY